MRRLHSFMVAFCAKVIEESRWGDIKIIYSGYNVAGEGEHKIL